MSAVKLLAIAVIFLSVGMIANVVLDMLQPTRAEVVTICKELIEADSLTVFDKKNVSRLERYILIQGLVLTGELEPEALYPEIQWFMDRNDQRTEELNDNLED